MKNIITPRNVFIFALLIIGILFAISIIQEKEQFSVTYNVYTKETSQLKDNIEYDLTVTPKETIELNNVDRTIA